MIILQKIKLTNFLSHLNTEIEFQSNQKLLLSGVSGSGKSSIVEAIPFVLYNKSRVDNNRLLVKHKEKIATVELHLKDIQKDKVYNIKRSISTAGKQTLEVLEDSKPILVSGLKNIQTHIENEILKSSFPLFINSVVYFQDDSRAFVRQPANIKKDILLEIVSANKYDEYLEKTKEKLSEFEDKSIGNFSLIDSLNNSIEADKEIVKEYDGLRKRDLQLNNQIKEAKENIKRNSEEWKKLSVILDTVKFRNEEISLIQKKIKDLANRIEEEETKINKVEVKDLSEKKLELESLRKVEEKVNQWNSDMMKLLSEKPVEKSFVSEINLLKNRLDSLKEQKVEICPEIHEKCPLIIRQRDERIAELEQELEEKIKTRNDFQKIAEEYNKKIRDLGECPILDREKFRELQEELTEYNDLQLQQKEWELNIKNYKAQLASLEEEKEKIKNEIGLVNVLELSSQLEAIKNEASKMEKLLEEMQSGYSENLERLSVVKNTKERLNKNEMQLKELKDFQAEVLEKIDSLKLLKDVFGPNGIKSLVIDYILPRLENRINEILNKLSDFKVRLDTQKSGVSEDTTLEGLFISVFNELGEEMSINNLSGGEFLRVSVAINEGLASVSQCNFRIFDETIIGLDETTIEGFSEVMLELQKEVNQILVISHIRQIQDLFDEKVEVQKRNGVSQIIK